MILSHDLFGCSNSDLRMRSCRISIPTGLLDHLHSPTSRPNSTRLLTGKGCFIQRLHRIDAKDQVATQATADNRTSDCARSTSGGLSGKRHGKQPDCQGAIRLHPLCLLPRAQHAGQLQVANCRTQAALYVQ